MYRGRSGRRRSMSSARVLDQIEKTLPRIDDDGARVLAAGKIDDLPAEARVEAAARIRLGLATRQQRRRLRPIGRWRVGAHAAAAGGEKLEQSAAEIGLARRDRSRLGILPGPLGAIG